MLNHLIIVIIYDLLACYISCLVLIITVTKFINLFSGPLLDEIVTRMYGKKNGTLNPNRMLWIYSAHDFTILNLLNAMKLYDHTLVPYAAVLMIELRLNNTGNYVVTVSFSNILLF